MLRNNRPIRNFYGNGEKEEDGKEELLRRNLVRVTFSN